MIGQFSFYDKQKLTFDHYFNFGCLSQNQNSPLPWIVRRANAEVGPSGLPLYSAKLKAKFVKKEGGGDFFLKKKNNNSEISRQAFDNQSLQFVFKMCSFS